MWQALIGVLWLRSYSSIQHVRPLSASLLSKASAGVWGEATVMAPPPAHDSAVSPRLHGCLIFLHRHFPTQSPLSRPLRLSPLSQQQNLPWDCSTIPVLQTPAAVPSRGSLSGVCMAVERIVCVSLIQFRLPQIVCFTFSLKCFSSDPNNCPIVRTGPLLQLPHPPRAGAVLLTLPFCPLLPSSYRVLCGYVYSFPVVRYFCPLLVDVLQALLCP